MYVYISLWRDVEYGEKDVSKHVNLLLPRDKMARCEVTDVPDIVCSACVLSTWTASGLFMDVLAAM